VRDDDKCLINVEAIQRWRQDWKEGKFFYRTPPGTNCQRCTAKRKACELPGTLDMRRDTGIQRKTKGSVATTSEASSSKRKFDGVEMPMPKRVRAEGPMMSEGQLQAELLEVLRGIREDVRRMADAGEESARQATRAAAWILEVVKKDGVKMGPGELRVETGAAVATEQEKPAGPSEAERQGSEGSERSETQGKEPEGPKAKGKKAKGSESSSEETDESGSSSV